MTHTTETLTSADNIRLHVNHWATDAPKAVVVIAHGLAEHSGRYAYVAEKLNAAGYAVIAPDHRTHGKSGGEPRTFVTTMQPFVDDLNHVWEQTIARQYPDAPVFLVGHSMGGLIAVLFALQYPAKLRGLVTSGTAMLPGESIPGAVVALGKLMGKIAPKLPLAALDSADISRDPDIVARYDSDPLNYRGKVRAGIAGAMFTSGAWALRHAGELQLPLLVMHGESDKLIPNAASRQLYDAAGSADKTLVIYPELYHEIFNEPEKDQVLADLIQWLNKHV